MSSTSISKNNIDNFSVSFHGIFIWSLATLFYFYDNLLKVSPGAMKPELVESFNASGTDLGILSSAFLWTYGIMQIPVGLLMDKYGPRKLLSIACIFAAVGCLIFSKSTTLYQAIFGRGFIGIGASFAVVGCLKISSIWFSPRKFALLTGLMVTVGFLGNVFGMRFVSTAIQMVGTWQGTLFYAAALGGILLILLWAFIRDKSPYCEEQQNSQEQLPIFDGIVRIMKSKQTWLASLYAGLMFVPTLAFDLWGIPFLSEAYGFDKDLSGEICSFIYLGWIFGAPMYGFLSDHLGRRNAPMLSANIFTLILCLIFIYSSGLPIIALKALLFAIGFFSSGFILAFAVVRESNPSNIAGTSVGVVNALNTFGGAAAQPIIGWILDIVSKSNQDKAIDTIYTLPEYQKAFTFLPACLIVSLIIILFVKETYCKPHDDY